MNVVLIIFSYLIGSINFAYLVSKLKGIDIKDLGSGNPGSSNVLRTMGKKYAIFVLFGDMLKGFIPVIIGLNYDYSLILGFVAVIGHCYPIFYKFKGGKGVATYFGVYLAYIFNHPSAFNLDIPFFKVNLVVFFIIFYFGLMKIFRVSAVSSLTTVTLAGFSVIYSIEDTFTIIYQVFIILLIFYQHRENLQRLFKGEENKF
ncbi:MAG: glycerol-3-phosphate 1-O-acyltransferase PlsY [Actinomycetota bacterium]|nr:glycerol-3-phosphate 1-O-acyltransferase PlsY [Actinomycetota bacterium]|tara:strand:- start:57 stop:662 length:606 start_codon:yes stop_codon:yes gene_type:complete